MPRSTIEGGKPAEHESLENAKRRFKSMFPLGDPLKTTVPHIAPEKKVEDPDPEKPHEP